MNRAAVVLLALAVMVQPAFAQGQVEGPIHCPDISTAEARGIVYSYNGGPGKHFSLQLQAGAPDQLTCSAKDRDATDVTCTIARFSGIVHVAMDGADSYFKIEQAPDIRINVAPGQPVTCILQSAR